MRRKLLAALAAIGLSVLGALFADWMLAADLIGLMKLCAVEILNTLLEPIVLPVWLIVLLCVVAAVVAAQFRKRLRTQQRVPLSSSGTPVDSAPLGVPQLSRDLGAVLAGGRIDDDLRHCLLGYQNEGEIVVYKKGLCGTKYEPGTLSLAEIGPDSQFMGKPLSFDEWLDNVLDDELLLLKNKYGKLIESFPDHEITVNVRRVLELQTLTGHTLKNEIWYQEYSDVLRRIILYVSNHDPNTELELYPHLTFERKQISLEVLSWIAENKRPSAREWLSISIAAGLMGVDEKSSHTAASVINRDHVIPLDSAREDRALAIRRIGEHLWQLAHTPERIDATEWWFQYLRFSSGIKIRIASFPDDYIETIFLLQYYQELLDKHMNVEVDCIPRSVRCGNDAKYADIIDLLSYFPALKESQRFRIHDCGPKLGTIHLLKLHPSVLHLIEECDFVDARGARSYEMMQGIEKDVFFGFMVCREFSESTTGLLAEKTPLVFFRQPAGERSFQGFRRRHERTVDGRMFCLRTAADDKEKWQGGHLATFGEWTKNKRERYQVNQAFYSRRAPDFHKKYGDHLETEVKEYLDEFTGRVLVLGCGSGKEVNYLSNRGCNATGVDYSAEAVWLAKRLYPHLWNRFLIDDIYNIRLIQAGHYQGIVANAVLVHLLERSDIESLVAGMKSRLCKDGIGFVRLIDKDGVKEEYDQHLFNMKRWFIYYTLSDFLAICEKSGLDVVRRDRIPHPLHSSVHWISVMFRRC